MTEGMKQTRFTNGLTDAQIERLVMLSEECGEIVQAVSKILRHGNQDRNPNIPNSETNQEHLGEEIGNFVQVMLLLEECGDVTDADISRGMERKVANLKKYTHHQGRAVYDAQ